VDAPHDRGAGTLWKVAHTTAGSANLHRRRWLRRPTRPTGLNIAYSSNAITWSRTNVGGADARVNYVAAGNGVFIAATQTGGQIYRSHQRSNLEHRHAARHDLDRLHRRPRLRRR